MSDSIQRLYDAILAERERDDASSRTAKLMREGTPKIAKKLAEEAVEVGHEAILNKRGATIEESADVLYNLAVLWADAGIRPEDVWAEMTRREAMMGIAEKLPKSGATMVFRPKKTGKKSGKRGASRFGLRRLTRWLRSFKS